MMYKRDELSQMGTKALLVIAKDLSVVGRHDMRKEQLVDAIVGRQNAFKELDEEIEADGGPVNYSGIEEAIAPAIKKIKKDIINGIGIKEPQGILNSNKPIKPCLVSDIAKKSPSEWEEGPQLTGVIRPEGKGPSMNLEAKKKYIENAKIGTIVAFTVSATRALSGKIEEIHKDEFVVTTRKDMRFTVKKHNVIWVKSGERWPKGVYAMLKGETPVGQR